MKQITREWLAFLREQYPVGSRIRLNSMEDPYAPVEPGTMGTLQRIDDAGQFLMKWNNGRTLSLIPGEDSFSLILPEPTMMKLYMLLHADLYTKDDWSDTSEEPEMLTGRALMEYEDSILIALIKNRMSEEAERGIMRWYGREDSVDRKVKSVVFTAEEREGQLWGVAECKVVGELTPEELDTLKDYISGQASDGWGEGFEQREIQVDDGELYVHLWNFGDWSIQTEEECFSPKLAEGLPDMCFSTLKSTGDLICIKRGESGYYPSDWNTADKARNEDMADELNEKLGVTSAQRQAMEVGSMAGWNVPGANPAAYHPLSEMERVPAEELPKRLDELFDRMDKENVGFVVTEEGKDSCVFCPYKWFELEYETIEVAVDEVLLAQIKEIITPLGWTVERLIVRFLEWLVDPETQEEAIAWLMKAKEELGEK